MFLCILNKFPDKIFSLLQVWRSWGVNERERREECKRERENGEDVD